MAEIGTGGGARAEGEERVQCGWSKSGWKKVTRWNPFTFLVHWSWQDYCEIRPIHFVAFEMRRKKSWLRFFIWLLIASCLCVNSSVVCVCLTKTNILLEIKKIVSIFNLLVRHSIFRLGSSVGDVCRFLYTVILNVVSCSTYIIRFDIGPINTLNWV